jgi:hypothetical protein
MMTLYVICSQERAVQRRGGAEAQAVAGGRAIGLQNGLTEASLIVGKRGKPLKSRLLALPSMGIVQ